MLVVVCNPLFIACHNSIEKRFVVVQGKRRQLFKTMIFLIFSQLMRHPLMEVFHFSDLLQMLNDYRLVDVELLATSRVVVKG